MDVDDRVPRVRLVVASANRPLEPHVVERPARPANDGGRKNAITAPVAQAKNEGTKIAMSVPVSQEKRGEGWVRPRASVCHEVAEVT